MDSTLPISKEQLNVTMCRIYCSRNQFREQQRVIYSSKTYDEASERLYDTCYKRCKRIAEEINE